MTKQLWSINALATEFDRDRRTVALALKNVRPDGRLKGHAAWHLDTALAVLQPVLNEPVRLPDFPQPFAATLAKIDDPGDRMAVTAVMDLVYRAPARATMAAAQCGLSVVDAYRFRDLFTILLMGLAEMTLTAMKIPPFASGQDVIDWNLDSFDRNHWANMAEAAGEPHDEAAWEEAALKANREQFGHA